MTTITIDRTVIAQALAFVRWNSFGECRTPEWPGPPPTAKETADALTAALAAQQQQPERKPMTGRDIVALSLRLNPLATSISESDLRVIRETERHHGIKEKP